MKRKGEHGPEIIGFLRDRAGKTKKPLKKCGTK
jgi:hypothetical protein